MRTLPHHFQSMERAAAWYPTRATPTFSRFHSQASITELSEPVSTLHPTHRLRQTDTQSDTQTGSQVSITELCDPVSTLHPT